MTIKAPFQPTPGSGQSFTAGATANKTVSGDDKQIVVTNTHATDIGYIRVAAGPATAADMPVLPGKQVCLTKGAGVTTVSVYSAGTPTMHICTGNGWLMP